MIRNIKKYYIIMLIIILLIVIVRVILFINDSLKIENIMLNALNNDFQYDFISDNEMKAHKNAKKNENNEYDITSIINNYIDNLELCVKNHIEKKYNYNIVDFGLSDSLVIHGLNEDGFEYIYDLISSEDIKLYRIGKFKEFIINKLKKIINYKEENNIIKWYIANDVDKQIELPYNVYIIFVHSDKKSKEVKYIKSLKFVKEKDYNCIVEYEKTNGTIVTENILVNQKKIDNEKRYVITGFNSIYFTQTQSASLKFGQHDYDKAQEEELKKEAEEPYVELPHRNWDDYDDEGNYIGETSSARVVTSKEEFEEMIRKNSERAKELGIEESTISREEAIERLIKIKKEAGIE